ncbi:MAG: hypothetical protein LBR21_07835 [Propionibacteriaceae bacterium]|jgi:hypothetical protein|nr:hypothetical protein [Propionibacteriaceae bacterium]
MRRARRRWGWGKAALVMLACALATVLSEGAIYIRNADILADAPPGSWAACKYGYRMRLLVLEGQERYVDTYTGSDGEEKELESFPTDGAVFVVAKILYESSEIHELTEEYPPYCRFRLVGRDGLQWSKSIYEGDGDSELAKRAIESGEPVEGELVFEVPLGLVPKIRGVAFDEDSVEKSFAPEPVLTAE